MGQEQSLRSSPLIQPVPGSFGAPVRKRGYATVYTESRVYYVKINPGMRTCDLKTILFEHTGLSLEFLLNGRSLSNEEALEDLGIREFSIVRGVSVEPSTCCPTKSPPKALPKAGDLSKYSVPDIGLLTSPRTCKRRFRSRV